MKKYLLTIILILVAVLASPAAETMVKEGMRWETQFIAFYDTFKQYKSYDFATYHFSGHRTVDGKDYLVLHQTPANDMKDVMPEGDLCLMREDSGKVYIRLTEDCILMECNWYEDMMLTNNITPPQNDILVFDGNLDINESMTVAKILVPMAVGGNLDYDELFPWRIAFIDMECLKKESLVMRGKFYYTEEYTGNFTWFIKGIGSPYGLPAMFCEGEYWDNGTGTTLALKKVYDGDELIYTYDDVETPAYKPMIREDRVWEYWEGNLQMFVDQDVTVSQYRFDGTRDVDGHSYNILKRTKQVTWTSEAKSDIIHPAAEPVVDDSAVEVALLREENGMIWMHRPDDRKMVNLVYNETTHNLESIENNDNEVVIYNYCAQPEEAVTANIFSPYEFTDQQISLMSYTVGNSSWEYMPKMGYFNHFTASETHTHDNTFHFVSGVGNAGDGTFFGPMFIDALPDNGQTAFAWFNNQYDLDGNVVFEGRGMEIPKFEGVSAVASDAGNGDNRMYDLMGREISNPLPGTIYIRGGRKYVAR